ncbi:6-bladed beta-propeller [Roseivirga sp.]|uniref:6-bladed beta-propeller n=1 Tax=Roseivirga sp. TaxID=1964215 RepID=UPI003BAACBA4
MVSTIMLFAFGCSNPKSTNSDFLQTISIDPSKVVTVTADQIFSNIDYVILSNDDHIIGSISKIKLFDDQYFVLDADYTNSLYVHDSNGLFITKIGMEGVGPEEYQDINDFTIVTVNGSPQIWLLDIGRGYFTLVIYDLNGNFITKIKSNLMANFIEYFDSGLLLFSTANQCNDDFCSDKFVTDLDLNVLSVGSKPLDFYEENWIEPRQPISVSNTQASITTYGQNSIESIDTETGAIVKDIFIDFGDSQIPEELMTTFGGSYEQYHNALNKSKFCYEIDNLFRNKDALYFSFDYGNRTLFFLSTQAHDDDLIFENIKLSNDSQLTLNLGIDGSDGNTLFSQLNPEYLQATFEENESFLKNNKSIFKEISEKLTKDSNHVILRLELK